MNEPVYQREGPGLITKVVSTVIAGLFVWQMISIGSPRGIRASVIALLPWLMIWFPDTAASYLGHGIRGSMVSRVGWFIMASLVVALAIFWLV